MKTNLPDGRILGWYGDDFTGSAAVLEVLEFAGVPAVLFLDVPTPEDLAEFDGYSAVGIAGIARSETPEWMDAHLPRIFHALAAVGASVSHYKVCSTLDSSPEVGSIGRAIELGAPILGGQWHPVLIPAPIVGRYQSFGTLFASAGDEVYRLDRHPVMSRHPVTPMHESDVRVHLASQTTTPMGLVDIVALRAPDRGAAGLARARKDGDVVVFDAVESNDLARIGALIWEERGSRSFVIGSQGVEYALVAHWRALGAIPSTWPSPRAEPVAQIAVVSGSVSMVTAGQISWAVDNGFEAIAFEPAVVVEDDALEREIDRAVTAGLRAIDTGKSVVTYTALGPGDAAVARFQSAVRDSGLASSEANARIGRALGQVLDRLLRGSGMTRAVISGGDTSGYAALELGISALTAVAPTIPGAALFRAHFRDREHRLELALKGGQMGSVDYFGWIRDGAGLR